MSVLAFLLQRAQARVPATRRAVGRIALPPWFQTPFSRHYGTEHGTAIDRLYVAQFLASHRADIRGEVLELKDDGYTRRFGQDVTRAAVLDIDPANARADIVADLQQADAIADASFDCFILTQTLQLIPDVRAALAHARRILRPGGVLLATLPALSQPTPPQADYWRFLPDGARLLFGQAFPGEHVEVSAYGNLAAVVGGLAGLAQQQLAHARLAPFDAQFPLVIAVRAVRGGSPLPGA